MTYIWQNAFAYIHIIGRHNDSIDAQETIHLRENCSHANSLQNTILLTCLKLCFDLYSTNLKRGYLDPGLEFTAIFLQRDQAFARFWEFPLSYFRLDLVISFFSTE